METSYLKTLELDKIIARAAEGCVCKEARAMLLAIEPQCDPDEVRYALEQTDAINTLLIKNGSPRFGGVEGVSQLAARAVKGGVLSMGELLMVAGALRNFQHLTSWYGSSEHDALPTDDLFYALAPEPGLEQQISSAILAPDAMADTASRTLAELRKKIRATENSIRDRLESMVRNMDTSKYLQESVVSMRNGRYVVPVKSEYRGEVSGIIPYYLTDCWKWAVEKSQYLKGAELKIETLPAVTYCEDCKQTYPTVKYAKICPHCKSEHTYLLSGNEYTIKEIEAC